MIKIIGPRDKRDPRAINTTSHSSSDWSSGLSPFKLGPVSLYDNHTALIFENAWQFSKLYPQHADSQGQPSAEYWKWAQTGWTANRPFRYPLGKGHKPLCSLWKGQRLGYVAARKQIYLPLYQKAVAGTNAYHQLESIYRENGSVTLFDFDGYDHSTLNMSLADVLNCPTRICGHAFVLSMMLIFGRDFTINDVEESDQKLPHPITIVNIKTHSGLSEYIGRPMPGRQGSPLANRFKVKPFGSYSRHDSIFVHYRPWLWKEMQKRSGPVYAELIRLALIAKTSPLTLSCWCSPEACHGDIVKKAILFLIKQGVA